VQKGYTPLMIAAEAGRLDIVRYLVRMGADVNLKNDLGASVFDISPAPRSAELRSHGPGQHADVVHPHLSSAKPTQYVSPIVHDHVTPGGPVVLLGAMQLGHLSSSTVISPDADPSFAVAGQSLSGGSERVPVSPTSAAAAVHVIPPSDGDPASSTPAGMPPGRTAASAITSGPITEPKAVYTPDAAADYRCPPIDNTSIAKR